MSASHETVSTSPAYVGAVTRWRDRLSPLRRRIGATGVHLPVVAFLAATLLARVLTDDLSSPTSRHSGNLNFSGIVAGLFIVIAAILLLRRRRGLLPIALASIWLCAWTAIALGTRGASAETLREGVREGSVVALAAIVYNARAAIEMRTAARIVVLVGVVPAILAVYQLATGTGMNISGNVRSNGTFAHPNSAAMFFAIAAAASLWLYLDGRRRRYDLILTVLFGAALLGTYSIDGVATLAAMLGALGALYPGAIRTKLVPWVAAGSIALAFLATPLGAHRVARESSSGAESNTSLAWRLEKWKALLSDWKRSPVAGRGLGTTVTEEAIPGNRFAGEPPHNEYVRYLVETGVVGLLLLLGGLAVLIRRLAAIGRLGVSARGALSARALALALVFGCLVNALADNTFLDSPSCYAAALIVVAAIGLSAPRSSSRQVVVR